MMSKDNKEARNGQEKIQAPNLKGNDRNELERKRRNRFSSLFDQLAASIADRCTTKKSTEKSQILRHTIEYFREQEILASEKDAHEPFGSVPAFITDDEFSFVFLESMRTFIFAMDQLGNIIYVSDNVHASVGHFPDHILQRSVFEFIHSKDHLIFQALLSDLRSDSPTLTSLPSGAVKGRNRLRTQRFEPFSCHFCQGQGNGFEAIHCVGAIIKNLASGKYSNLEFSKCLLVIAKPLNRVPLNTTLLRSDGPQTEFTARLNMEAKYDYLDKRVASVLGYFPSELIRNSLFHYLHFEDLDVLVEYHKILLLTGTITTCYYRHLTKGQSWIWLQSRYHLSYSEWSSKPQAVTSLSWVVPYAEVREKQKEILTRDREKFAYIRGGHDNTDGMSISLNDSLKLSNAASQDLTSKTITEKKNSDRGVRYSSLTASTESLSSSDWTPEPEDSQTDICASLNPAYNNDLIKNELIECERFLQKLNLPLDLTTRQQNLHRVLAKKYTQLISDINKQNERLGTLQKQLKVQGELCELIERLEKVKSRNDSEKEYTITKELLAKFQEIRRVCAGTLPEKPATDRLAICSSRLEENRSQEQRTPINLPEEMTENGVVQQRNYSPVDCLHIQAEQSPIPKGQPDIFFNQENWLETQVQQVKLQQQEALMKQMRNTHYIPQEQLMMMLHGEQQQQQQQQMADQYQQQQQKARQFQQQQMTHQFQQEQLMMMLPGEQQQQQQQQMADQFQQQQQKARQFQQQQMTYQFQQEQLMMMLPGEQQQHQQQQQQQQQQQMADQFQQQQQKARQFQQQQITHQFQQEQLAMMLPGEQQQEQMTQQFQQQQQTAWQFQQQQRDELNQQILSKEQANESDYFHLFPQF